MNPPAEKAANVSAAVAAASSGISWATANEVVQFVAGVVAIITGLAATYYYIRRARK